MQNPHPFQFPCFHLTQSNKKILLLFLKSVSLDVELRYVLWTSAMIIELRCGQGHWTMVSKGENQHVPLIQLTCKLDLAVLPKVIKYFAPTIPWFWTMEIGLMCVFWTNTVIKACVQLPLPLRKNCCTWATEIIEWACCHWTDFC